MASQACEVRCVIIHPTGHKAKNQQDEFGNDAHPIAISRNGHKSRHSSRRGQTVRKAPWSEDKDRTIHQFVGKNASRKVGETKHNLQM